MKKKEKPASYKVKIGHIYTMFFLLTSSFSAHAAFGSKARGFLDSFKADIDIVIPIIATLALIGLGIAYLANMINKSEFFKWAAGVLVVGSAGEITTLLLGR